MGNWEGPLPGGSGQIGKLGKFASRRERAMWETGIARFLEEAGKLGYWESPLPGGSVQIGKLGKPASRRKRADWKCVKRVDWKVWKFIVARFPEEACSGSGKIFFPGPQRSAYCRRPRRPRTFANHLVHAPREGAYFIILELWRESERKTVQKMGGKLKGRKILVVTQPRSCPLTVVSAN